MWTSHACNEGGADQIRVNKTRKPTRPAIRYVNNRGNSSASLLRAIESCTRWTPHRSPRYAHATLDQVSGKWRSGHWGTRSIPWRSKKQGALHRVNQMQEQI
jgi:hypothetical protein